MSRQYAMAPMLGPTPLETMLGALMSWTHVIAHECGVDLTFRKITCIGYLDHRGTDKQTDVPIPFPEVELTIAACSTMDVSNFASFQQELEQHCPMSVILRHAGTEIVQNWIWVDRPQ